MQNIIPSVRDAKDFVGNATSSSNTFVGSLASSILSDMTSGKRSSSIDISGKSTNDIRYVLGTLNQMGYIATLEAGNKLAIRW